MTIWLADLVIAWARGAAWGLTGLVIVLAASVAVLRLSLVLAARRRGRCLDAWRTRLLDAVVEPKAAALPRATARDLEALIPHWNHLHGLLRGHARDRLVALGHEIGLAVQARQYLGQRSLRRRLLGIVTLGNLRAPYAWAEVRPFLDHRDPSLALAAMRALLAIDVEAALPVVVPAIAQREDWSLVAVAPILHEVGFGEVAPVLAREALRTPPAHAARLVQLLGTAHGTGVGPLLREVLRGATDERLITVCLQALREPEDLDLARGLLAHPQWFVRVAAAAAVGRLGVPGDEERLAVLLGDRSWWVRYRAAKALAVLPFVTMVDMAALAAEHDDAFARDIVIQVLAELAVA